MTEADLIAGYTAYSDAEEIAASPRPEVDSPTTTVTWTTTTGA